MEKKLIVFDRDDVMWELNRRVAKITGIPYEKFICFSVLENPLLTEEEKERVMEAYRNVDTFKDIPFIPQVVELINDIYTNHPAYEVRIISNCLTQEIADVTLPQMMAATGLPRENIQLNVISCTEHLQKKLPDDIFIFVDDSPYNIALSKAVHNIMPARRHNDVLVDGCLNGKPVDYPSDATELVWKVITYMNRGR